MLKYLAPAILTAVILAASANVALSGVYFFTDPGPLPNYSKIPTGTICIQDKISYVYWPPGYEGGPDLGAWFCGDAPQDVLKRLDPSQRGGMPGQIVIVRPAAYLFEKEIYDGLQTKKGTDDLFQKFSEELKKIKSDLKAELKDEILKELKPIPRKQPTPSQKGPLKSDSGGSKNERR